MRKAQYTKPDRPLLVTVPEFQGYTGLGRKTAQRIAEEAAAVKSNCGFDSRRER